LRIIDGWYYTRFAGRRQGEARNGYGEDRSHSAIRVGVGRGNTDAEIETAIATIAAFEPLPRLVRLWTASEAARDAYAAQVAALPPYLRATRREDYWFDKLDADPLSDTRALPWERTLDDPTFVRAGVYPREMEDKWFVYECDGTVHCHRSWTGYEIFSFRIRGARLDQLQVCADPERFKGAGDDAKSLELANWFVDSLASGRLR
jgi:hypothetical protein